MTERAEHCVSIEQLPVGRQLGLPSTLQDQAIDAVNYADGDGGNKRSTYQSMGNSSMMLQAAYAAPEVRNGVNIRSFGGQYHGQSGQSGLAVEPGPRHAGPGQKVGDGFQESASLGNKVLAFR